MNKVTLCGHLGRDPEIRSTGNGTTVANISLATSRRYRDRDGNWQKATDWHRLVAFGRQAEVVRDHLGKGAQVLVEGRLQTRKWQDNNGNDRYTTEVVIGELEMLGGGKDGGSQNQTPSQGQPQSSQQAPALEGAEGGEDPFGSDDIPF